MRVWAGSTPGIKVRVAAGVAQGCPLSGLLFVGAVQPLLDAMKAMLALSGDLWAFADDLAALLRAPPGQLKRLSALFRIARLGTGTTLKPAKSVSVPLAGSAAPGALLAHARALVSRVVPERPSCRVARSTTYLGLDVGPGAMGESQWQGAVDKFRLRTCSIAAAGAAASLSFKEFATRALPCLGYVGQLAGATPRLARLDRQARARLLHTPFNAIPLAVTGRPAALRLYEAPPAHFYAYTCRVRAATTTCTTVHDARELLIAARAEVRLLRSLAPVGAQATSDGRPQLLPTIFWIPLSAPAGGLPPEPLSRAGQKANGGAFGAQ